MPANDTVALSLDLLQRLSELQHSIDISPYMEELKIDDLLDSLSHQVYHLERHCKRRGYPEFLSALQTQYIFRDATIWALGKLKLEERRLARLDINSFTETIHKLKRSFVTIEQLSNAKRVRQSDLTKAQDLLRSTICGAKLAAVLGNDRPAKILYLEPLVDVPPEADALIDLELSVPGVATLNTLPDDLSDLLNSSAVSIEQIRRLDPHDFEALVSDAFKRLGYKVEMTKRTRDGGVDLIAFSPMWLDEKYVIECKRYGPRNKIDTKIVRAFNGALSTHRAHMGIIITTSTFSQDALLETMLGTEMYRIELHDYRDLMNLLRESVSWSPQSLS